jgi:hypothetical protein
MTPVYNMTYFRYCIPGTSPNMLFFNRLQDNYQFIIGISVIRSLSFSVVFCRSLFSCLYHDGNFIDCAFIDLRMLVTHLASPNIYQSQRKQDFGY